VLDAYPNAKKAEGFGFDMRFNLKKNRKVQKKNLEKSEK
jgi:hypothetical protein